MAKPPKKSHIFLCAISWGAFFMTKKENFEIQIIKADVSPDEADFKIAKVLEILINPNENQFYDKQNDKQKRL